MVRRAATSSTQAYIFVSLNLVLLLVFLLLGVESLHNVYNTTSEYDSMLHNWFALRLEITDMAPGDSVHDLPQFQSFQESLRELGSSELLVASARLSVDLQHESLLLGSAWREFVDTSGGRATPMLWDGAQERLERQLLRSRDTIGEVVDTQDRALTVLLYCLGATVVIVMVVFVIVEVENERGRRLAKENQMLARNSLASQEAERTRIAHELHDSLAQDLSTAMLETDLICANDQQTGGRPHSAQKLRQRLESMIVWVRNLAYELRPPEIDAIGLVAALRRYCEDRERATQTRIGFTACAEPNLPADGTAITAYRIVQEAITNAIRHSAPSLITVEVFVRGNLLIIVAADNGAGSIENLDHLPSAGLGIAGMKERARMLGANLQITSRRGEGTTVRLAVPVGPESEEGTHA